MNPDLVSHSKVLRDDSASRFLASIVRAALSLTLLGAGCGSGSEGEACPATGPCWPGDRRVRAEIRGVVLDRGEDPVAGAIVETEPPTSTVETGPDGRFSMPAPRPDPAYTIAVVARHPTLGEARTEVVVSREDPTPEVRLVLP